MKVAVELQPILKKRTGVGWYNYNIAKHLGAADMQFSGRIFNFLGRHDFSPALEGISFESLSCTSIPYGVYNRLWNYLPLTYDALFREQADIYHFFNFICPPKIKGKVIITVYDMVFKLYPETMTSANFNRLKKNLLRSCQQADAIITISQNSKSEIVQHMGVPEEKIHIIPPAVDFEVFHPKYSELMTSTIKAKYKIPHGYFLYLGTIEPRKNIPLIIRAYKKLSDTKGDIPGLVLAGTKGWKCGDILAEVDDLGLNNKVKFTEYIDQEDVPILMKGAKALIFPSFYEGFGMPPLEAMACGTPVIVSNSSSLPEVVGSAGMLIDPCSDHELYEAMVRINEDRDFVKGLKALGLKQALKFSWQKSADQTIMLYRSLMGSK